MIDPVWILEVPYLTLSDLKKMFRNVYLFFSSYPCSAVKCGNGDYQVSGGHCKCHACLGQPVQVHLPININCKILVVQLIFYYRRL
jgi:hypothetical protein